MNENIDKILIRKLAHYHVDFNDLRWINCYLHNADMQDFGGRDEFDNFIRNNDEFLLIFIIIYSFERMGFDSKLARCKNQCELYTGVNATKIKTHPLAVLKALIEIKEDYGANDIKGLLDSDPAKTIAVKWFEKSIELHNNYFRKGFNKKGFGVKSLNDFLNFFASGKICEFRDLVRRMKFGKAFNLITKINGIGSKLAKFIMRDVAFSLNDWGKGDEINVRVVKEEELHFVVPIDRWVRRISMAIPLVGEDVKRRLEREDLASDSVSDKIDDLLSIAISRICCKLNLNPMRYDLGAYMFGVNRIRRSMPISKMYGRLKENLL